MKFRKIITAIGLKTIDTSIHNRLHIEIKIQLSNIEGIELDL